MEPTQLIERDFLRTLVGLGSKQHPEELLATALHALVDLCGASRGYVTVRDDLDSEAPFQAAFECSSSQVETIEQLVSKGIIAETLSSGRIVQTALALSDPRFAELESVQEGQIESVLCGPVGSPPIGVVYLQRPFKGAGGFGASHHEYVGLFAAAVAPLIERLALRSLAPRCSPSELSREFGVVGESPSLVRALERLRAAAPLDLAVLLTGDSGTGKTHLARAVHTLSGRTGAFVELNCAAIPEALFESELFGAAEGAHSAAPSGGACGKIEAASEGTLFLDEVTELSLTSQAKLLQFLQSRQYFRLGDSEVRTADVRVIAASNRDVDVEVASKRLRADLAYRLRVFTVRIPSLSDRGGDLEPLATHFVSQACARHGFDKKTLTAGAALSILLTPWPGNVRELAHRIETAVVQAEIRGSSSIERPDLEVDGPAADERDLLTLHEATRRFQRELLVATLGATEWNVAETARRLDVARSHAYKMIQAHGLSRREEA